jgi:hypothetical protein
MSFDAEWAAATIADLADRGVTIAPALTDRDIAAIGSAFRIEVPPEYALLLSAGTPASERWTNWHSDIDVVARDAHRWLERAFSFDIEHNAYWHPLFGQRPDSTTEAISMAMAYLATAPALIPVYGHRFLTTGPPPRAVLSVWQAGDSIVYGYDLADYLAREFDVPRPGWAASSPPPVPVWDELFDLFCLRG